MFCLVHIILFTDENALRCTYDCTFNPTVMMQIHRLISLILSLADQAFISKWKYFDFYFTYFEALFGFERQQSFKNVFHMGVVFAARHCANNSIQFNTFYLPVRCV